MVSLLPTPTRLTRPAALPFAYYGNGHCPSGRPHWWLIPSPEGPTSVGECRFCGARKGFLNFVEAEWKDELEGCLGEVMV